VQNLYNLVERRSEDVLDYCEANGIGFIPWYPLANGDLASVLIFGAFLIYAIVNRLAVIPRGDPAPVVKQPRSDLISIGVGVVAYAVFVLWLHGLLFGVSPIV